MANLRKIGGFTALLVMAGVLTSVSFWEHEQAGKSMENIEIWSTRESAIDSVPTGGSGIYAMQGAESDSDMDYNSIIPIEPRINKTITENFDNSVQQLDLAMQESAEIMKSLNTNSAAYLDNGQLLPQDQAQMNIDEFEMQSLEDETAGNISSNINNQVIADVDISYPAARAGRSRHSGEISSATMKVVDVLLKYGMDDRAVSVIERDLNIGY